MMGHPEQPLWWDDILHCDIHPDREAEHSHGEMYLCDTCWLDHWPQCPECREWVKEHP